MSLEFTANQLKACGHPARLRILNLLQQQPSLCVCELMRVLDFGQSFVSRHLAILREADLVLAEKQGTWAHYRLMPTALPLLQVLNLADITELQADIRQLNDAGCKAC